MQEPMKIIFLFFCFWNISVNGEQEKYCSSEVINGVTFTARCSFNGTETPCDGKIRPNTRAVISCSVGYRKPLRNVPEIIQCGETGEWDYHPASCVSDCGKLPVSATPFINGGEKVSITKVPWHTAIYKSAGDEKYVQICGGTIYSAKLVISAAHCFWDIRRDKVDSTDSYQVGVGKLFRGYDAIEPLNVQFLNISAIHIPISFSGPATSYKDDIAILILSDFIKFSEHVRPICIKWLLYSERHIKPTTEGRIPAWGNLSNDKSNSNFNDDLRVIHLQVDSKEQCLRNFQNYSSFFTNEKFCVGSATDGAEKDTALPCDGTSGGGFEAAINDEGDGGAPTHYLLGVLSVRSGTKCERDQLTTFTNIQYFKEMITDYEIRYRPK